METLNYHHLRYFREVAHEGNLTRAADRLNLSQSALSSQIRTLEDRLGHALFDRTGRRLVLTEAGRIALNHADRIFGTGKELIDTLERTGTARAPLRVGALSTLSRNFQMRFLEPLLHSDDADVILKSGSEAVLLRALTDLRLDVVLSTAPPKETDEAAFIAWKIDEQPVGLFGRKDRLKGESLAALLQTQPLILPTESALRTGFEALVARMALTPRIAFDVDDMAMARVLARAGAGLAIVPSVVVQDELRSGLLQRAPYSLDIMESFYAVTIRRSFPHPLLSQLLTPS
ncbi:LysR family transcriptional regulator [Cognatishimia sp. F0-27]|uniref:LysR family transcriptional regulator n=1 Tax=Cognatishimia sp. F0-27 TaxID=2816855 RepID=UPI001D0C0DF0|nr:LysR family transcriptional regulator [Cognatishimia sp. F0-27]MCC1491976.1 LysR family transcriptional regulator [Cognatishimia sp. F0-27]